ncbi:MAG TPA: hypothetical protein VL981_08120 [Candidatus Methylacidiphilales bacterium]|nr:hypothetical protein [Candidatus Methylacidiphilales bacterium]
MSKWRILAVAFWVFIAIMLAWQAYTYNNRVVAEAQARPESHYIYHTISPPPPPKALAADVRQTAYHVIPGSPEPDSFMVTFTVKNVGNTTATGVEVNVRPYRGIPNADEDDGDAHARVSSISRALGPISDQDPLSQIGQWVSLPDLPPGQSSDESAVFPNKPGIEPNQHPQLEITFKSLPPQ